MTETPTIEEIATILALFACDYFNGVPGRNSLIDAVVSIACNEGWNPEDFAHPEGIEALSMYVYALVTGTWEQSVPPLTISSDNVKNNQTNHPAWRWKRVLNRAVQLTTSVPTRASNGSSTLKR